MSVFLISLVVTLAVAPVVRSFALRAGFLDVPNHRSSHTLPTPRVGGIACIVGVVVACVAAEVSGSDVPWWVVGGALTMAAVGLADDRASLPTLLRLGLQIVVGLVCGFALGGPALAALGALAVPVVVNAVNFMDGVNAISSLTLAVWGITTALVGSAESVPELQLVGAAAAAAALGFLPWNAPHARLFLGDGGSYFFGCLVALGIVLGVHEGVSVPLLVAPLAVYAADTAFTLAGRAARGEPVLEAHRSHVYQRLTNEGGLPHVASATIAAGFAALVTAGWWWLAAPWAVAVTVVLLGAYLLSPRLLAGATSTRAAST